MKPLEGVPNTLFGLENSSTDANKFYSIMLDARAIKVSANMCDIAEKLVVGEKDNAKRALEQLWALKKNLTAEKNGTIDLLIRFYQDKIDVLRAKEEHIKRVSKDSRGLLEEKRKKDEEIASVKQQISDCERELVEMKTKLDKLVIKEAELSLIESQVRKELDLNENEIVNGLYEIILAEQEHDDFAEPPKAAEPAPAVPEEPASETDALPYATAYFPPAPPKASPDEDTDLSPVSRVVIMEEKPPFPRFIVKTTAGRVIGEYYFDAVAAKEQRHYIFNTKFFAAVAAQNIRLLKTKSDTAVFTELLQMIQDVYKRTTENPRFHFEVATNEILNEHSLKQLWLETKTRSYDEMEKFCQRLLAKIEGMGGNYRTMVQEQMARHYS